MSLRTQLPLVGARLNRRHPDAYGLAAAVPCFEGIGYPADVLSGRGVGAPYGAGVYSWQDGGLACSTSLATTGVAVPIQSQAAPLGFTIECWVKLLSIAVGESWAGNASASTWLDLPAQGLRFIYNSNQCGSSVVPPVGQWLHIVGTAWTGGSQLWLNGVKIQSSSTANVMRTIQSTLYTHNHGTTYANSSNAVVKGLHAWTRTLDPQTITRRYNDPWSMYLGDRRRRVFLGAIKIFKTASEQAQLLDAGSLSAATSLVDSASEVDSAGIALAINDLGALGESTSSAYAPSLVDSGSFAEGVTSSALALGLDSASLTEALATSAALAAADGMSFGDLYLATAALAVAHPSTMSEGLASTATRALTDAVAFSDFAVSSNLVLAADSASAVDGFSAKASLGLADPAHLTEFTPAIASQASDAASAFDSAAPSSSIGAIDAARLFENVSSTSFVFLMDSGSAADATNASALLGASDEAQNADVGALDRNLPTHLLSLIVSASTIPDPHWTKVFDS